MNEDYKQDEIVIDYEFIGELKREQKRIWQLFNVNISYGNVHMSKEDNKKALQWVTLIGKKESRIKARDYIISLCNPEDEIKIELPKETLTGCNINDLNNDIIKNYQVSICLDENKAALLDQNVKLIIKGSLSNILKVDSILMEKIDEYSEIDIYEKLFNAKSRQTSVEPSNDAKNEELSPVVCLESTKITDNIKIQNTRLLYSKQISLTNDEVYQKGELRLVIIDGNDVAIQFGKNRGNTFSCKGIKIAVDYFSKRGHKVEAYVPRFRRGNADRQCPTINPEYLDELDAAGILKYCPSKSYDDRFIIETAIHFDGVIVSNNQFTNVIKEYVKYKDKIKLLEYLVVEDAFIPVADPSGVRKPCLSQILSKRELENRNKPRLSSVRVTRRF